jgi:shikimate 5-dehydrogenase
MDTVYTPQRTPLILQAENAGARTIPGVDMFLRQAAMQFEMWTGSKWKNVL